MLSQVYADGHERRSDGTTEPLADELADALVRASGGRAVLVSRGYDGVDLSARREGRQGPYVPVDRADAWLAIPEVGVTTPR